MYLIEICIYVWVCHYSKLRKGRKAKYVYFVKTTVKGKLCAHSYTKWHIHTYKNIYKYTIIMACTVARWRCTQQKPVHYCIFEKQKVLQNFGKQVPTLSSSSPLPSPSPPPPLSLPQSQSPFAWLLLPLHLAAIWLWNAPKAADAHVRCPMSDVGECSDQASMIWKSFQVTSILST